MEGYRHPLKLYDIWSYDSNYIELHCLFVLPRLCWVVKILKIVQIQLGFLSIVLKYSLLIA